MHRRYAWPEMSEVVRTPEAALEGLPDFPFSSRYREVDGLRLAHLDEGEGPPVIFFHGEPTWSFLWRKVIPPVRDAGFRCIAPDLPGFGRSDKPTDVGWYSFDRHCDLTATLFEDLDLRGATVVVHDWGGAIGLNMAVELAPRIDRMVILDTGLFTGRQRMSEAWLAFHDFVERTEDLPVGMLVRRACKVDPGDEVAGAYEAPYPTPASKAGARAFPLMMPRTPEDPGAARGQLTQEALEVDTRPKLFLWADSDPILPLKVGERMAERLNAPPPRPIADASHFLQEDQGPLIGALIAEWLTAA